jgi:uncharacterized protein (DUF302 family)
MTYYIARTVNLSFDNTISRLTRALDTEGFGVLADIDVSSTMKAQLGLEVRPYRILGVCNPRIAHKALAAEDKIGTMLPCNLIVQENADGDIEVAAIDPVASMAAVDNPALIHLAARVRISLERALDNL